MLPQIYAPFYVKNKRMDNFVWLLEFECTKKLRVHSQAIPYICFNKYEMLNVHIDI